MDGDNGWKFAQCFGDKGDIEEVSDGKLFLKKGFFIIINF